MPNRSRKHRRRLDQERCVEAPLRFYSIVLTEPKHVALQNQVRSIQAVSSKHHMKLDSDNWRVLFNELTSNRPQGVVLLSNASYTASCEMLPGQLVPQLTGTFTIQCTAVVPREEKVSSESPLRSWIDDPVTGTTFVEDDTGNWVREE